MPAFRYLPAFAAACLLVLGGIAFCIHTKRAVIETVRERMREEKRAGELPDELVDVDIDTFEPSGVDIELPENLMTRMTLADFLSNFWIVLVPAVFVVCFGVAGAFPRHSQ